MIEIYNFSRKDLERVFSAVLFSIDEMPMSKYEKKRYYKLAHYLNDRIELTKKLRVN